MIGKLRTKLGVFTLEDDGNWTGTHTLSVQYLNLYHSPRSSSSPALGEFGLLKFDEAREALNGEVLHRKSPKQTSTKDVY